MRSSRDSEPQAGIGAGVAVGGRILVVGRRVGSFEELDCGVGGTSDGRGGGDCGESWKKSADAKAKRGYANWVLRVNASENSPAQC